MRPHSRPPGRGRGGRRRALSALQRAALSAEAIERVLTSLRSAGGEEQAALCRLETSLSAAALHARRLSAGLALESPTFTEGRSDEDWRRSEALPVTASKRENEDEAADRPGDGCSEMSEY